MKQAAGIPREVQNHVLSALPLHTRRSVVSVNRVMASVRRNCPSDAVPADDVEFARHIKEAALSLGLVPVYDPSLEIRERFEREQYPGRERIARRARG